MTTNNFKNYLLKNYYFVLDHEPSIQAIDG